MDILKENTNIYFQQINSKYDIDNIIKKFNNVLAVLNINNYYEILDKLTNYSDFIVAYKDTENILGYIAIYANDYNSKIAYITLIAVNRKYQGQGIGKKLIKKAEDISSSRDFEKIRLEVHKENCNAIHFYENLGFKQEKDNDETFYMIKEMGNNIE